MVDDSISKDVDYNVLLEQEKRARLDNDIPTNASKCVEIVSFNSIIIIINYII